MTLAVKQGPIYKSAENVDLFVVKKEKNQLTHQCFVDFTTFAGKSKYRKWQGKSIGNGTGILRAPFLDLDVCSSSDLVMLRCDATDCSLVTMFLHRPFERLILP